MLKFKHVNNVVQLAEPENDGGTGSGMNPLKAHGMIKYIQSAITSNERLQTRKIERTELLEDLFQMSLVLVTVVLPYLSIKLFT